MLIQMEKPRWTNKKSHRIHFYKAAFQKWNKIIEVNNRLEQQGSDENTAEEKKPDRRGSSKCFWETAATYITWQETEIYEY